MSQDVQNELILWLVVALRVFVPLLIPRFPLPAGIAAMVIDAVDQTVFQQFTTMNLDFYQGYDKALDVYYLSIEYISIMLNWTNFTAARTGLFLFYFRLVGTFLFEIFHVRALLLIFTNAFEYVFLAIEAIRTQWDIKRMAPKLVLGITAFIWVFIKLPQEYWIHIAKLDLTDAIRAHAVYAAAAGLLLLALLVIAYRVIRPRVPPRDWAWRFDANRHDRAVSPEEYEAVRVQLAHKFWDAELLEKVILIGLVSGIFGQILPDFDVSEFVLVVTIMWIVLINTAISELLVRRGRRYRNAWTQFFGMFGINVAYVVGARILFGEEEIDFQHMLFFLGLIALMVTLFDRYRPYSTARFVLKRAAAQTPPV